MKVKRRRPSSTYDFLQNIALEVPEQPEMFYVQGGIYEYKWVKMCVQSAKSILTLKRGVIVSLSLHVLCL